MLLNLCRNYFRDFYRLFSFAEFFFKYNDLRFFSQKVAEVTPNLITRIQTFWTTQTKNIDLKKRSPEELSEKPKEMLKKYPKPVDLFDFMEKI